MTAAEIAAKLTPAQIRALRDPNGKHLIITMWALCIAYRLIEQSGPQQLQLTDFGREVLAVIKEAGK